MKCIKKVAETQNKNAFNKDDVLSLLSQYVLREDAEEAFRRLASEGKFKEWNDGTTEIVDANSERGMYRLLITDLEDRLKE